MDRIWTVLAVLVILFGGSIWGTREVEHTTTEVSEILVQVQDIMDGGDTEQSRALVRDAVDTWHNYHHLISYFIPRKRLESVSQTLSTTQSSSKSGTRDEVWVGCNRALGQLHTSMDTELLNMSNILRQEFRCLRLDRCQKPNALSVSDFKALLVVGCLLTFIIWDLSYCQPPYIRMTGLPYPEKEKIKTESCTSGNAAASVVLPFEKVGPPNH